MNEKLLSGNEISRAEGEILWAGYVTARARLCEEILPEIKAIENDLTDHGPSHIRNVLNNIFKLIEKDLERLTSTELYLLCLVALFHDVGNIHGRRGHYDKKVIFDIYGYVRGGDSKFDSERIIVADIASTHSGKASDGSSDTLRQLSDMRVGFLEGSGIERRKLAAILRFADELAEGPQRTSNFMLARHKYSLKSRIYHRYAQCNSIFIDNGNGRIALTYTLKLNFQEGATELGDGEKQNFVELIDYIYLRISKLNQERLYNRYYCQILSRFRTLSVRFDFIVNGQPVDIGLGELIIDDLQVPGERHKLITEIDKAYEIENILNLLTKKKSKNVKRKKPI